MLVDLTVKEFLAAVAGNDPVPGGGSVSALNAAVSAALAGMVANLTIGKKKYADKEEVMKLVAATAGIYQKLFIQYIDMDSYAYSNVFETFKLPKDTDKQKDERNRRIQKATRTAAEVPMAIARDAFEMMDIIELIAEHGNQNAITDACVSMMTARTAVLGALLNVRINLSSIDDKDYVKKMASEADRLESEAKQKEQTLLNKVKEIL